MASKKKTAVTNYIAILFVAAFFLLMMTYLMEQREVAESLQGIRSSVSAMESMEQLYQEKLRLMAEMQELLTEIHELEEAEIRSAQDLEKLSDSVVTLSQDLNMLEEKYLALSLLWIYEQEPENLEYFQAINSEHLDKAMKDRYDEIKSELGDEIP